MGNSNVFGNFGATLGDLFVSNVVIGDIAFYGNVFTQYLNGVNNPQIIGGALSDETTVVTVSNSITLRLPFNWRISNLKLPVFSVNTAPATTNLTLDIQVSNSQAPTGYASIYSTKPFIATTKYSTNDAGSSAGVLSTVPTSISEGYYLKSNVSSFTSGTAANGLKVVIYNS